MKKLFAFLVAFLLVSAAAKAQLYITGGISAFGGDAFKQVATSGRGSQQQQAQAAAELSAGFNAGVKYKYKLPIPILGVSAVGHFNYATGKSQEPSSTVQNQTFTPPQRNITALVYGVGVEVVPIGFLPIIDPYVSLDYTLNSVKTKQDALVFNNQTIVPASEGTQSGSGLGIGIGTGIKLPIIPILFDVELKYRMLGNSQNLLTVNLGAGLSF
ncbi:MAG: hypothetical protein NZM06_07575 [Chloroherpetonaceae bacterium]|nr:hypothetical protein [Chloroherpetonaceae bacterium]MDW8437562.1 hypothetical protein [Chloroherpetonaceae bacterium]